MDFTPTQKRILEALSDGLAHPKAELATYLWDDQGAVSNVQVHISNMRKKLRDRGEYIICELRGYQICYRHVVLLTTVRS